VNWEGIEIRVEGKEDGYRNDHGIPHLEKTKEKKEANTEKLIEEHFIWLKLVFELITSWSAQDVLREKVMLDGVQRSTCILKELWIFSKDSSNHRNTCLVWRRNENYGSIGVC